MIDRPPPTPRQGHTSRGTCEGLVGSCKVNLTDENCTTHSHGDGNDGEIHSGELETLDVDVLPGKDISPQKAG